MDLKDQRALITGGTSGMGIATARSMAEKGASVIITGLSPEIAQTLVTLGVDLSTRMLARAAELTDAAGLANVSYLRADAQVHPFEPAS